MNGLIKSGALRYEDRPIWYDAYAAFPPKIEPLFTREAPSQQVRRLLYSEDEWRATFYQRFAEPEFVDLERSSAVAPSIAERFVRKCEHLAEQQRKQGEANDEVKVQDWREKIIGEAVLQLKNDGVSLKTREQQRKEEAERLRQTIEKKKQIAQAKASTTA